MTTLDIIDHDVYVAKKHSGNHPRPPNSRLPALVTSLQKSKVLVYHPGGRQGFEGHPIAPRRIERWMNEAQLELEFRRFIEKIGMTVVQVFM